MTYIVHNLKHLRRSHNYRRLREMFGVSLDILPHLKEWDSGMLSGTACQDRAYVSSPKSRCPDSHYVYSGIDIPVVGCAAFRTIPTADFERQLIELMSAMRTSLARGLPLVNLD